MTRLVGRQDELRAIEHAVRSARRLVVVTGEVGIGKTRLVTDAAQGARELGAAVAEATFLPLGVRLPLLPFTEILRVLEPTFGGILADLPAHTRDGLARLVPELAGDHEIPGTVPANEWQRRRMFTAVGQVLSRIAARRPVVAVVEDLHWADEATLDLLTYLRAAPLGPVTLIVTCRDDEPLEPPVARWLEQVRRPETTRVELTGLSRTALAELAGLPPDSPSIGELARRTQGNPFFAQELLAAEGDRPPRALTDLLLARSRRAGPAARTVLAVLAVAARPVTEALAARVTGMTPAEVASATHELVDAKLAVPDRARPELGCRVQHALLAEAVAGALLADERRAVHAGLAAALRDLRDPALSAEIAGHWSAAGRPREEFAALVDAAEHSHRLCAFSSAADLWQRAVHLTADGPDIAGALRVRTIDALRACGRDIEAEVLTEETYALHRDSGDRELLAAILHRTAWTRGVIAQREPPPGTADGLFEHAAELFEALPETATQARFLADHARFRWMNNCDIRSEQIYRRAVEVAERCGAPLEAADALTGLADIAFLTGDPADGFALLDRASEVARTEPDSDLSLRVGFMTAECRSNALYRMGRLDEGSWVALDGLERARRAGTLSGYPAAVLHHNAAEPLLEMGRVDAAAAVLAGVGDGPPQADDWNLHLLRAQVEICRGAVGEAVARTRAVESLGLAGPRIWVYERVRLLCRAPLWAGDPARALGHVEEALALFRGCAVEIYCGELLALGARAVADMAETARARRGDLSEALAGADRLRDALDAMGGRPFREHPFLATIPGDRADWDAEIARARGVPDADAWEAAARVWEGLGRPHRRAYALWRRGLLLTRRDPAAVDTVRAAASAATGMAPLESAVRRLAQRARITLSPGPAGAGPVVDSPVVDPFGLTARERLVLGLLAEGRTNAQIGAALFMSPKTASVHVSRILRKLDASNRVEAAAMAERAGLTGA
ncbi:AAA family ATPase [Actinoplanes sp. NPDC051861]|uniref:helix-turn-helix transcriptional regulator n=1 Tax=Actinoplanes sp. NPDC051861 TaxID=3155170 RepID=UPI00343E7A3D